MTHTKKYREYISVLMIAAVLMACGRSGKKTAVLFQVQSEDKTGLHFSNKLTPTQEFNIFHYMYFYNGAGIGAGDFNNDGLIDLFFAANQGDDKLYLNKGDLHFTDITTQ